MPTIVIIPRLFIEMRMKLTHQWKCCWRWVHCLFQNSITRIPHIERFWCWKLETNMAISSGTMREVMLVKRIVSQCHLCYDILSPYLRLGTVVRSCTRMENQGIVHHRQWNRFFGQNNVLWISKNVNPNKLPNCQLNLNILNTKET